MVRIPQRPAVGSKNPDQSTARELVVPKQVGLETGSRGVYLAEHRGRAKKPGEPTLEEANTAVWSRVEERVTPNNSNDEIGQAFKSLKDLVAERRIPLHELGPLLDHPTVKPSKEELLNQLSAAILMLDLKNRKVGGEFPGVTLQLLVSWRIRPAHAETWFGDHGNIYHARYNQYLPSREGKVVDITKPSERFHLVAALHLAYQDFKARDGASTAGTVLEAMEQAYKVAELAGKRERPNWLIDQAVFDPQTQLLFAGGIEAGEMRENSLHDEAFAILRERFESFRRGDLSSQSPEFLDDQHQRTLESLDRLLAPFVSTDDRITRWHRFQDLLLQKKEEFDSLPRQKRALFLSHNEELLKTANLFHFGLVRAVALMAMKNVRLQESLSLSDPIRTLQRTLYLFPPSASGIPSYFRPVTFDGVF